MKTITYIIGLLCLLMSPREVSAQADLAGATSTEISAGQWSHALPQDIFQAISKGDAMQLSSALNASVELAMPQGSSHVYSRNQAEVVLSEFFSQIRNPQFNISHERSIGSSTQTIGTLSGDSSKYRIFILTQQQGSSVYIHQLKFEVDR